MSPPSRRLQTKPVITCLKTFLISYSLIFWSTNAPYVLIGTGSAIVIFGLFGCFATCRGSPWMLKLYAMFLTLVFLAELVAGISGFIFRHEIKDILDKAFTHAVTNYNTTDSQHNTLDTIQQTVGCCGANKYTDWNGTAYFKEYGIPESCCINKTHCTPAVLKDLDKAATEVYTQMCTSGGKYRNK
ncbi:hypothetical protein CRUP_036537 [Coryphaenoides rupestris]|nr:hypothetical protein CRUP_036537 [Coryphaenoides rupestris]